MRFSLLAVAALFVASSSAAVIKRSGATCGSKHYTQSQVSAATNEGYSDYENGTTEGGSTYPHQYNNYEGFSFGACTKPYYEFPLVSNGPYSGGAPGPDRVVFDHAGHFCGSITHTGASGNNFVACS